MNECNNSKYKEDEVCYSLNTVSNHCGIAKATLKKKIASGKLKAITVPRCCGNADSFNVFPRSSLYGLFTDDIINKLPVLKDSQPAYWEERKREQEEREINRIKREKECEYAQKEETTKCNDVNTIRAFPTFYDGIQFRSRLEARWAIFFNACGIEWEYEPEGYQLSDGQGYLPDFLLHGLVGRLEGDLFVEVKGQMTLKDEEKIKAFISMKKGEPTRPLLILGNIFSHGTNDGYIDRSLDMSYKGDLPFFNYLTIDGDYFGCVLGLNKEGEPETFGADSSYLQDCDEEKTEAAFQKALNAQFTREGKYIEYA